MYIVTRHIRHQAGDHLQDRPAGASPYLHRQSLSSEHRWAVRTYCCPHSGHQTHLHRIHLHRSHHHNRRHNHCCNHRNLWKGHNRHHKECQSRCSCLNNLAGGVFLERPGDGVDIVALSRDQAVGIVSFNRILARCAVAYPILLTLPRLALFLRTDSLILQLSKEPALLCRSRTRGSSGGRRSFTTAAASFIIRRRTIAISVPRMTPATTSSVGSVC